MINIVEPKGPPPPDSNPIPDTHQQILAEIEHTLGDIYAELSGSQRSMIMDALIAQHYNRQINTDYDKAIFQLNLQRLALLRDSGALQKFLDPSLTKGEHMGDLDAEAQLGKRITLALGKNFVHDNLDAIYTIARTREPYISNNQSDVKALFHVAPDASTIRILKGGFKKADDHQRSYVGTGTFEKEIGLQGVFATRGIIYSIEYDAVDSDLLTDNTVFVFGETELDKPHTVGIQSEASLGRLYESILEESEKYADEEKKYDRNWNEQRNALAITFNLLDCITPPERVAANDDFELCLDVEEIDLPTMLFVGEEPEYYYDQAAERWGEFASRVPIITRKQMIAALNAVGFAPERKNFMEELILEFTHLVNSGTINIEDWKYTPED